MSSELKLKVENEQLKEKLRKLETVLQEYRKFPQLEFSVFSSMMDESRIGIVIHNGKEILYVNNAVLYLTNNTTKESFVGKQIKDFVPSEMEKLVWERINKLKEGISVVSLEEKLSLPNGKSVEVIINALPVLYNGKWAAMLMLRNISEGKKEKREKELLQVLEQVPASIIITDSRQNIQYVNKHFYDLTGYNPEEVINSKPSIISSGRYDKKFYKKIFETVISGKTWEGQMINRKKDGRFYWEEVVIKAIFDKQGTPSHFFSIQTDITEKINLIEDLRIAKENLELKVNNRTEELERKTISLERMQEAMALLLEDLKEKQSSLESANRQLEDAVSSHESFSYSVSHDLKKPVQNIYDLMIVLKDWHYNQLDDRGKELMDDIMYNAKNMILLIEHLLKFL